MTTADIATANEALYVAFRAGDFAAIAGMWAERLPVVCIHPGWDALLDRPAVLDSWRAILASGGTDIRCVNPRILLDGDRAWVVCEEHLPQGVLIATNVFQKEAGSWRLVFHQAGPLQQRFEQPEAEHHSVH